MESKVVQGLLFSLVPNSKPCKLNKDRAVPENYWKQNKFLKIY